MWLRSGSRLSAASTVGGGSEPPEGASARLPPALTPGVAPLQTVLPGRVSGSGEALRALVRLPAVLPRHRAAPPRPADGVPGRPQSAPGAPGEASRLPPAWGAGQATFRGSSDRGHRRKARRGGDGKAPRSARRLLGTWSASRPVVTCPPAWAAALRSARPGPHGFSENGPAVLYEVQKPRRTPLDLSQPVSSTAAAPVAHVSVVPSRPSHPPAPHPGFSGVVPSRPPASVRAAVRAQQTEGEGGTVVREARRAGTLFTRSDPSSAEFTLALPRPGALSLRTGGPCPRCPQGARPPGGWGGGPGRSRPPCPLLHDVCLSRLPR